MEYSTLKRKTPLKQNKPLQAKTSLRAKTELKAKKGLETRSSLQSNSTLRCNSTLKARKSLQDSYKDKIKTGEKKAKKTYQKPYKPKYPYWSIFTDDLKMCYITGDTNGIHIHHIFNGANKWASEKYGFLVPLRYDWHDMASYGIHFDREFDLRMRRKCQKYWLEHYGTKEEFIAVFGKWW